MSLHHRSHLDPKDLKNSGLKHVQPIETTGPLPRHQLKRSTGDPRPSLLKHQISFSLCTLGSSDIFHERGYLQLPIPANTFLI